MIDAVPGARALTDLVARGGVTVLSGAGISTESGIPDYRGPDGTLTRHTPMTYQTFTRDPAARQRYWARSHLGWRTVAGAAPNAGHRAVAALQRAGLLSGLVTQNVDGLHQAAGADAVVELHGNLARVVCLDCGDLLSRDELHTRLCQANPGFDTGAPTVNPDGDVELPEHAAAGFRVVGCGICPGGMLKPDVVFFGEAVPPDRVRTSYDLVDASRALVVLGSSLAVMSGRRFVLHAARRGIPVAIVNRGVTRADRYAAITVDAPLGGILPLVARELGCVPDAAQCAASGRTPPITA